MPTALAIQVKLIAFAETNQRGFAYQIPFGILLPLKRRNRSSEFFIQHAHSREEFIIIRIFFFIYYKFSFTKISLIFSVTLRYDQTFRILSKLSFSPPRRKRRDSIRLIHVPG